MADGLNRAQIFGNLGADPELRHTNSGDAILSFRVATTESYVDKNRERREVTEWHSVTVWGKRGEALHKLLRKGSRVYVEGKMRTTSYDDKEGVKRYRTSINASAVILADGKKGGTSMGRGVAPPEGMADGPPDDYGNDAPPEGYEP